MSRNWKSLPTHLPGWYGYKPDVGEAFPEPKSRKLRLKIKASRRSFHEKRRKKKLKRLHHCPFPEPNIPTVKPSKWTENSVRILLITGPNFHAKSTWRCKNHRWTCIKTDPPLDWFKQVVNPEIINSWVFRNNYEKCWLKASPDGTVNTPSENRLACPNPAQNTSVPSGSNTTTSLNVSRTETLSPDASVSLRPAQTGLAIPCCLIESEETDTLQTLSKPV